MKGHPLGHETLNRSYIQEETHAASYSIRHIKIVS